ncbi:MAG: BrnT family toxin [Acidobacteria bacterium]|nr:BrnT family toxin [Acidobacteriota bacterium]
MNFDEDPKKAAANIKKTTENIPRGRKRFGDPLARIFDDDEHSYDEKRNAIFGYSDQNRLLMVSYTERENDTIRIISARLATPKEARRYADQT